MSDTMRWSVGCTQADPGQHDVTHVYEAGQRHMLARCIAAIEAVEDCGCLPADAVSKAWVCDKHRYLPALQALGER